MQTTLLSEEEVKRIRIYFQRDVSFLGDADAEHDTQRKGWLEDLFVNAPEFGPGITGKSLLVVGRKGSGKSAIRIASSLNSAANIKPRRRVDTSASADDLLTAYKDISSSLGATLSTQEGTVQAWQRTFVYLILKALARDLTNQPITAKADEAVRKWALDKGLVGVDWGEWLVATSRRTLPQVEKALKKVASPSPLTAEAISQALDSTSFTISVDDFDNIYNSEHKTQGVRAVQAAIEAADRLSRRRDFSHITLYLREDLWLLIRHDWHYLDKVTSVLELNWSEHQLKAWTERRLRRAAGEALRVAPSAISTSFDQLWSIFFPLAIRLDDGNSSHGFWYLLRKTMFTPRDLHKIFTLCAKHSNEWPVHPDALLKAEEQYAQDRIDFISNEFGALCEGLSICLNSFTGKSLQWNAGELYKHLKGLIGTGQVKLAPGASLGQTDEVALARFLFRVGFLEVRIPQEGRFEVRDGVRYPEYWKGIRKDDAVKWAVRSAFFRYLRSHNDIRRFFE
jgi:hypothetical protein